jgi:DNA-directed RNA polymerase specialized sigma24 family protein
MSKRQFTAGSRQQTAGSSLQAAGSVGSECDAIRWHLLLQHLRGLGSGPDHDDDVQDTLLALHRCWGGAPPLDMDFTWRYAAKALRRRRMYRMFRCGPRQHQTLGDAVFGLMACTQPGVRPLSADANPLARHLLGRLDFAVLAARMEGWPVARIAELLGTSRGSIMRSIRRYRNRAARIVEKSAEFGPDGTREALCLVRRQMLAEIEP